MLKGDGIPLWRKIVHSIKVPILVYDDGDYLIRRMTGTEDGMLSFLDLIHLPKKKPPQKKTSSAPLGAAQLTTHHSVSIREGSKKRKKKKKNRAAFIRAGKMWKCVGEFPCFMFIFISYNISYGGSDSDFDSDSDSDF